MTTSQPKFLSANLSHQKAYSPFAYHPNCYWEREPKAVVPSERSFTRHIWQGKELNAKCKWKSVVRHFNRL